MPVPVSPSIRRFVRGFRRAHDYPILLPHFVLTQDGVRGLDGSFERLPEKVIHALRLCDGTRRLHAVARESGASKFRLMQLHDQGKIILWFTSLYETAADQSRVTSIVVSPHLDDAALSAFHAVQKGDHFLGEKLVLDVFSRANWWRLKSTPASPEEIRDTRNQEERLMSRMTGARLRLLELPEALLRGYSIPDVFNAPLAERDADARALLSQRLAELVEAHPKARWYLPLGVGNHVDHVIARDETLAVLERAGVPADRILFYEDMPYAADVSGVPDFSTLVPGRRLRLYGAVEIIHYKSECLRAYWSQLTWGQIEKVGAYATRVGNGTPVERMWQLVYD